MPQLGTLKTSAGDGLTFETSDVTGRKVLTWHDAKRSGSSRWATHEVHLAQPVREFLGPGLDSMDFTIRLDGSLGIVPQDQLDALRALRDSGQVVTLVVGGQLVADFTIETISEDWRRLDFAGRLAVVELTLALKEYA